MGRMHPARRNFWLLAAVATVSMGALSKALTARPSPLAGLAVAASATFLAVSIALAGRIAARLDHSGGPRPPGPSAR